MKALLPLLLLLALANISHACPRRPPLPTQPPVRIQLETPYKLDQPPTFATRDAYRADLKQRIVWNNGGLGVLIADQPRVAGHPDPRVMVNVEKLRGGHSRKALQRHARKYQWMNIVRCYRLGAYQDPHLRGWTNARLEVRRGGTVQSARLLTTELKNKEVARCMVARLQTLKFSAGRSGSSVWLAMRVGPGDEPMPPPEDRIEAGAGHLTIEQMRAGVKAGLPELMRCYRQGLGYAPELWGRLLIRFQVDAAGVVTEAFETASRFPDPRVKQCLLHAARTFRFGHPRGGALRFVVPLRLTNDQSSHPAISAL